MFEKYRKIQFNLYNEARNFLINNPEKLIELEHFMMKEVCNLIQSHLTEIIRDYNETSFLYPFWQNYPPDSRGRSPIGDQYPWIEVGEHVLGPKLSRNLANNFTVRDTGLPTGPDNRYVLSNKTIKDIIEITDTLFLFVDIKSVGPRDDQDHTVMSHNQISGNGKWIIEENGVENDVIVAQGQRASHNFYPAIPPLYILCDKTIAPVIHIVVKPVYKMLSINSPKEGQPLDRIAIICIPNGILLTIKPNYKQSYPGILFPGKDDKRKDPRKLRARISFQVLREIAGWRYNNIEVDQ